MPGQFGRLELLLHDPEVHEQHGLSLAAVQPGACDILVTGRLVVDLLRLRIELDGVELALTAAEWRLLLALARRPGLVVSHAALVDAVWGQLYADVDRSQATDHMIRVTLSRLRRKLGPSETLIRTVFHLGYRLELAEAGTTPPPGPRNGGWPPRVDGWARDWERCRDCGTIDRAHVGHGRCGRCRDASRRSEASIRCDARIRGEARDRKEMTPS